MPSHPLNKATLCACKLLGGYIHIERKTRQWTIQDLAERMGVSHVTIIKIESGNPKVAIGFYFEAATLLNIPLFQRDETEISRELHTVQEKIALLPKRIRSNISEVDDDF